MEFLAPLFVIVADDVLAERVGFEPTVPCRTTVFETVRIGHSRTSPTEGLGRNRLGFSQVVKEGLQKISAILG